MEIRLSEFGRAQDGLRDGNGRRRRRRGGGIVRRRVRRPRRGDRFLIALPDSINGRGERRESADKSITLNLSFSVCSFCINHGRANGIIGVPNTSRHFLIPRFCDHLGRIGRARKIPFVPRVHEHLKMNG